MRVIPALLVLPILLALPRAAAAQCMACGPGLRCLQTPQPMARACLELPFNCILTGYCLGGGGRSLDGLGESVVAITLLEPGGDIVPPPRALPRAGRALIGREAAAAVRSRANGSSPEPEVVFSALLHGGAGGTVVLRSRGGEGDGFALRRDRESANGARYSVRALEHGRPGRVLASERLGEDDLLIAPVRFGGRTRIVALQALRVREGEREARLAPLRAAMAEAAAAPEGELPFEAEVTDD